MLRLKDARECYLTQTRFLTQNSEIKNRTMYIQYEIIVFCIGFSQEILPGSDYPSSKGELISIPITRYRRYLRGISAVSIPFDTFHATAVQEANMLSVCVCAVALTSKEESKTVT